MERWWCLFLIFTTSSFQHLSCNVTCICQPMWTMATRERKLNGGERGRRKRRIFIKMSTTTSSTFLKSLTKSINGFFKPWTWIRVYFLPVGPLKGQVVLWWWGLRAQEERKAPCLVPHLKALWTNLIRSIKFPIWNLMKKLVRPTSHYIIVHYEDYY